MTQRITKKDMLASLYTYLRENDADTTYIEFVLHELNLLNRPSKPTAIQAENQNYKQNIRAMLVTAHEGMTATQIAQRLGVSVQKVSQLMRQMIADNQAFRIEGVGKQKTKFFA